MSYTLKTDLANRSNYGGQRNTNKIKYLVFHATSNDGDTDESNARYFKTHVVKASAHAFVDDNSVTVSVPANYVAYSVGGKRYSDYNRTGGACMVKSLIQIRIILKCVIAIKMEFLILQRLH